MALPLNYRVGEGGVLADASSGLAGLLSHQVHSGTGTWAASDETSPTWCRPVGAAKAIKVQCLTPGAGTTAYRLEWTVNRAIADISQWNWPIYYTGNTGASVSFFLSQDAGFANYYNFAFASAGVPPDRWSYMAQARSSPDTTTGSPNPSSPFVRVRAVLTLGAGVTGTFYVGSLMYNMRSQPQVAFVFDDGDVTFYTEAFAYMQPRGIPGTVALNRNGSGNPLSTAQVQEMISAGWSMHSHGDEHVDMTTLSESQLVTQVEGAVAHWAGRGVQLDPDSFILPYGARNALVDSVLQRYYKYSCLASGISFPAWDGILDPYKIFRQVIDVPTTTATTIGAMDLAVARGNCLIYMVHKLAVGAPTGNTEIANFKTLVDAVYRKKEAGTIQVRNLADLFSGLEAPRRAR